jgi:prepilin-type N-terminal cleavage/methylation domain-containing protein
MSRGAFTLIELLVVVAVLAILAAIAIPNMLDAQTRSKVSRAVSDLRAHRTAIEAYAVDHSRYPRMTWGGSPYGDLYEGNGSSLQPVWGTLGPWITTPVSYITTYDQIDPFAKNPTIQADLRLYTYHDNATRRAIAAMGPSSSPFHSLSDEENDFFENNFGAFAQMSTGPDIVSQPFYLQYDPTNGTVSAGNIWLSQKHTDRVALTP